MSEKQSEKMYKTLKKQNKKLLFYLSIPTLGIILDLYFQFQIFTDKAPAIIVLSITLAVFIYIYFLASRIVILNNYIKALENNELKEPLQVHLVGAHMRADQITDLLVRAVILVVLPMGFFGPSDDLSEVLLE